MLNLFIADQQINAGDHQTVFQEAFYEFTVAESVEANWSDWDTVALFHYGA